MLPRAVALVRVLCRVGGRVICNEDARIGRLRQRAAEVRSVYVRKPWPKANVAALECCPFGARGRLEATSRENSPSPLPLPRSRGGLFEPSNDPHSDRPMDTDAEYKALSELGTRLLAAKPWCRIGIVYLFTERAPCASCIGVITQFEQMFPLLSVVVRFDHAYPT
jgi:hypothetical protein